MNSISINYPLIWQFKDAKNYQVTKCRKVFNIKTGKLIKQCLNGGSIGYWINSKFIVKSKLIENIEVIEKTECPF